MTEANPSWNEFISRSSALFDGTTDKTTLDDELLVHQLAGFAAMVTQIPNAPVFANDGLGPTIRTGVIDTGRRRGFFVLRWELDANALLPAHDHPNYSFCTVCVGGEVNVKNFELVDQPPAYDSDAPFIVRRTQDQTVAGGRINTLTRTRDNVHELRAGPDGAVGMDVGILHAKDIGFSYLELELLDAGASTYRARWNRELTRRVRGA